MIGRVYYYDPLILLNSLLIILFHTNFKIVEFSLAKEQQRPQFIVTRDSTTSVEYQLLLHKDPFQGDNENAAEHVVDWLNDELENKDSDNDDDDDELPRIRIRKSTLISYGREVEFYYFQNEDDALRAGIDWERSVLKHRRTIEGDKEQNEIVWKIRDITNHPGRDNNGKQHHPPSKGHFDDTMFHPHEEYISNNQWSYKIEEDFYCGVSVGIQYSSVIEFDMDERLPEMETVEDIVLNFFPNFANYYNLPTDSSSSLSSIPLRKEESVEYITDVQYTIGSTEDEGKVTIQLRYDSLDAYFAEMFSSHADSSELELSIKMKAKHAQAGWDQAIENINRMNTVVMEQCPYVDCL